MPNHVHLILTPTTELGLSRAIGEAHRRYTAFFNARARVTGHLFQGRFSSGAMDERHLLAAFRYLALNPVRAGLAARAEDWRYCSVGAHLFGSNDALVDVAPALARVAHFRDLLDADEGDTAEAAIFGEGADQPLRRQHFPHGGVHRHGALGPAPQAEIAGDRLGGLSDFGA
jgi:putative transposase